MLLTSLSSPSVIYRSSGVILVSSVVLDDLRSALASPDRKTAGFPTKIGCQALV